MSLRLGVLLAAVGGTLSLGATEASAALEFCERAAENRSCARLTVPLDRSGAMPGAVKLRIERQKAKRSTRPPLFLIAGGPGQSSIGAFDRSTIETLFGTEVRSRDIVVMDMRGTGSSGALDCRALQRGSTDDRDVAACAAKLGPRRDFYSSADMAEDIDAVRAELGAPTIALYGVSYGTHVALTYARRHPDKIDRLVLDSVVGPRGVDAFERPSMAAVPRVSSAICGKRLCRRFTRNAGRDAARLAMRLDRQPIAGMVTDGGGRRHRSRIDGRGFLGLVMASDLNSFLAAEIPAAIRNALRGDAAPLLRARAHARGVGSPPESSRDLSVAAYVATLCSDSQLPWGASTPLDGRRADAATFASTLGPDAFAPFGSRTALASDVLDTCRSWPSRAPNSAGSVSDGQLPDVPALLLSGGLDVRTPLESARAVADEMPRARLMVVGQAGHGVLGWDFFASCPSAATRRFLAGGDPGRCGSGRRTVVPLPAAPTSLRELRPVHSLKGRVGRTARAIQWTIIDSMVGIYGELFRRLAAADPSDPLAALGKPVRVGALRGGSHRLPRNGKGIIFARAVAIPGVRVNGAIRGLRRGTLRITGSAAAHGRLVVRGNAIQGHLGRRPVRVPIGEIAELFEEGSASRAEVAHLTRQLVRLR